MKMTKIVKFSLNKENNIKSYFIKYVDMDGSIINLKVRIQIEEMKEREKCI